MSLKHRDALLVDLAAKLVEMTEPPSPRVHPSDAYNPRVHGIKVSLFAGRDEKPVNVYLGLPAALEAIVGGLYWDENGDWSEADRVELDTY